MERSVGRNSHRRVLKGAAGLAVPAGGRAVGLSGPRPMGQCMPVNVEAQTR
ncbi:MAG: hypothetical protein ACRDJC_05625 [Thermomicrobiales bacterium]